ncbi:ABC transporter ATP-binding protein [Pseudomonas nitroreducens]|uniref:ABC transporter ATP-binding protein n=1 Tax=Pseudomonas nitroreducens TaxID=46680 RepID=A0A6G6J3Z5_PSENT|nr:ATP-binding cassette domain-containing protein [Pseudomonas nitroreducens]MBG6289416.1 ABC transporter ATP-binding protein [Pseudomonas nitroreducens]MDG9855393.1 ATP-binding cassette domain-containing protein [Pseudomonas nitroreducens]NMZ60345.1 ABC transporter ATP-binding protein [Pseudomonas nitroreducens]QIE89957.1 ABC transporter ATP-binding protein [Pseudomonas nitroreducens]SNT31211.1 ABC-2 type transport system ATP-binding protein/lipopolysaccharide transport system ATP-binding pro
MTEVAALTVDGLSLTFRNGPRLFSRRQNTVLQDISFSVERGETFGVVGGNGAGKSTLLRVLAGIYQPTRGHLTSSVASVSLLNLQLGFDDNLDASDNIVLSGMLMGMSRRRMRELTAEILDYAELGGSAGLPVRSYSTGMRARLGFAISKYSRPDVILLDEVLSVGDGHFREKAEATMREMLQGNQTVVFVSHDSGRIREMCSRVCWLKDGRVQMLGPANEVMDAYDEFILRK